MKLVGRKNHALRKIHALPSMTVSLLAETEPVPQVCLTLAVSWSAVVRLAFSQHVTNSVKNSSNCSLPTQDLAAALAAALPAAAAARGVHGSVTVASVRSAPELYPFARHVPAVSDPFNLTLMEISAGML